MPAVCELLVVMRFIESIAVSETVRSTHSDGYLTKHRLLLRRDSR